MTTSHPFQLRSDYWADASARAAFKQLVLQVFEIDFEPWDAAGYWDEDYHPFSLFDDNGRVVASACLYSMRMVIDGRPVQLGQVSSMAVLPDLRRQGLGREVIEAALRWGSEHGHEFFMLFSSEEALPFYRARGFTLSVEHRPVLRISDGKTRMGKPDSQVTGSRLLDLTTAADRTLLFQLACHRCPVSRLFGVLNEKLLMFRTLLSPRSASVCHIPSLDVAVFLRRREGTLTIFDIIGPNMPVFTELAPFLIGPNDREVTFWFMTDLLGDLTPFGSIEHRPFPDNNLHLKTRLPVASPFVIPFTAQA